MDDKQLLKVFATHMAGGSSVDAARHLLTQLGADNETCDRVTADWRTEVNAPRELTDPFAMHDNDSLPDAWYRGPQDEDYFWPLAVRSMTDAGLTPADINAVDRATSKVLSLTQPPGSGRVDTRGLVLGYVQSGKTTNFTGLIAKAADVGYRLFIVLTGTIENLRQQTQDRLDSALIAPDPDRWFTTTTDIADFEANTNAGNVLRRRDSVTIAVVKKNVHRLQRLNRWLDDAGETVLRNCPVMIIDDEADQASIDTSRNPDFPSRVNYQIQKLVDRPKVAYIAYTATPFANILIDPTSDNSLYPRSFIVDLPRPRPETGYLGTEEVFGRNELASDAGTDIPEGLDLVRKIPDGEAHEVRPPTNKRKRQHNWVPAVPEQMEAALRWFLLATAARRSRDGIAKHSSMLIHTTLYTDCQLDLRPVVNGVMTSLARRISSGEPQILDELRRQWSEEAMRVPSSEFGLRSVGFDEIVPEIEKAANAVEVLVDNAKSEDRVRYEDDPRTVVVIGGNTLSRGLTLEGLVSSYFVRTSRAYDSLLQMGRWFGYRRGWQDLPRVWMTSELWDWFIWLATVEEEIRRDVRRYEYERLTPIEFSVRIATHPSLAVTSALKMRDAVQAKIGYGGSRHQTILFNHRDREWLERNLQATRELVLTSVRSGVVDRRDDGRTAILGVSAANILDFFERYQFHENAVQLNSDLICEYVRTQNQYGKLTKWNVVIAATGTNGASGLDLGLAERVGRIVRSRVDIDDKGYANIKTLASRRDWLADLPDMFDSSLDETALWRIRREEAPDTGLLVVYPIDPISKPADRRSSKTPRVPLDAVDEVIGVAIVFPETDRELNLSYVTAPLPAGDIDEPEDVDDYTEESA